MIETNSLSTTADLKMARLSRRSLSRSAVAAYLCICVALALLLALTAWGAYRDLTSLREALLQAHIGRLRSHAERTVGRLERDIETAGGSNLDTLSEIEWLNRHWERFLEDESHVYAAIVGNDGRIWRHNDETRAGKRLPHDWYDRVVHDVGEDVVITRSPVLSSGNDAYDVHAPILVHGKELGEYHVGLNIETLQKRVGRHEREFLRRRAVLVGGVLLIVLLAATSLYYIATHSITLRRTIDHTSLERASEVSALAAGLAHEIRNPLQAIQLNLHTLQRAQKRGTTLSSNEMKTMLEESTAEIDRIEHLMQQLVGFATPEEPRDETIDVNSELRAVVDFIQQEMLRSNIQLEMQIPSETIAVQMDHGRLRQIMLNLLQNAQQAMDKGGRVRVNLRRHRDQAEITVADDGPGVAEKDRPRLFEPFFSTKASGTGLGLALVKRYVEEVDGEIHCQSNSWGGTTFRIVLPAAQNHKTQGRKR